MKIEKAIEVLPRLIKELPATLFQEEIDAINLGIEALKAINKVRPSGYWDIDGPLPSETILT